MKKILSAILAFTIAFSNVSLVNASAVSTVDTAITTGFTTNPVSFSWWDDLSGLIEDNSEGVEGFFDDLLDGKYDDVFDEDADLSGLLGENNTLDDWLADIDDSDLLGSLEDYIDGLEFESFNDILEFFGEEGTLDDILTSLEELGIEFEDEDALQDWLDEQYQAALENYLTESLTEALTGVYETLLAERDNIEELANTITGVVETAIDEFDFENGDYTELLSTIIIGTVDAVDDIYDIGTLSEADIEALFDAVQGVVTELGNVDWDEVLADLEDYLASLDEDDDDNNDDDDDNNDDDDDDTKTELSKDDIKVTNSSSDTNTLVVDDALTVSLNGLTYNTHYTVKWYTNTDGETEALDENNVVATNNLYTIVDGDKDKYLIVGVTPTSSSNYDETEVFVVLGQVVAKTEDDEENTNVLPTPTVTYDDENSGLIDGNKLTVNVTETETETDLTYNSDYTVKWYTNTDGETATLVESNVVSTDSTDGSYTIDLTKTPVNNYIIVGVTPTDTSKYTDTEVFFVVGQVTDAINDESTEVPTPVIYFDGKVYDSASKLDVGHVLKVYDNDSEVSNLISTDKYDIQWFRATSATVSVGARTFEFVEITDNETSKTNSYTIGQSDIGSKLAVGIKLKDSLDAYTMSTMVTESIQKETLVVDIKQDYGNNTLIATYNNGTEFQSEDKFAYQWSKKGNDSNFVDIENAKNSSYVYTLPEAGADTYKVTVTPSAENATYTTDSASSDEFEVKALTQLVTPTITKNGVTTALEDNASVESGDELTALSTNTGVADTSINYYWYVGGEKQSSPSNTFEVKDEHSGESIYAVAEPKTSVTDVEDYRSSEKSVTVTVETVTYSVDYTNLENLTSNNTVTLVEYSDDYKFTLSVDDSGDYKLPATVTVTMDGTDLSQVTTASSYYTYNNTSGEVTITNVTGDITITASAVADGTTEPEKTDYTITFGGSNATVTSSEISSGGTLEAGKTYNFTASTTGVYVLPDTINVTGAASNSYTNNSNTTTSIAFTVTTPATLTENIVITVNGVDNSKDHSITFKGLTNVSLANGNNGDTFDVGDSYTFTVEANEGYILPNLDTIVSYTDGTDMTRTIAYDGDSSITSYANAKEKKKATITIASVQGDIQVSAITGIVDETSYNVTIKLDDFSEGVSFESLKDISSVTKSVSKDDSILEITVYRKSGYAEPDIKSVFVDGVSTSFTLDTTKSTASNTVFTINTSTLNSGSEIVINAIASTDDTVEVRHLIGSDIKLSDTASSKITKNEDYTFDLTPTSGYELPTKITVVRGSATSLTNGTHYSYTINETTGVGTFIIYADYVTDTITIEVARATLTVEAAEPEVYHDISFSLDNITLLSMTSTEVTTLAIVQTYEEQVKDGGNVYLSFAAQQGFVLPDNISVIMDGKTLSSTEYKYVIDTYNDTANLSVENVTGNLEITIVAGFNGVSYGVTYDLDNLTHDGESYIKEGYDHTFTITADDGYYLPSSIKVYNNTDSTTPVELSNFHTYNNTTGAVTITGVTFPVLIKATGDEIPANHDIWFSMSNISVNSVKNATSDYSLSKLPWVYDVVNGEEISIYIIADEGYNLPSSITIKGKNTNPVYEYTESTGLIKVSAINDTLQIYATGVKDEDYVAPDNDDDDDDDDDEYTSYTITLIDLSGNTLTTLTTGSDYTLSYLPDLTTSSSNSYFIGWYTSGGTKVTTSTVFSYDTTLYARSATLFDDTTFVYDSEGNATLTTSDKVVAVYVDHIISGSTFTIVNPNGMTDFIIIPSTTTDTFTATTTIVMPDSNGNTITWSIPPGAIIDNTNYLNLGLTVSEYSINNTTGLGKSLGYIDFAHSGYLLKNADYSLTLTFRLSTVDSSDTVQIYKLGTNDALTTEYVQANAIGNNYVRASFNSCSRWEVIARNYSYNSGTGNYLQYYNIPTIGYVAEFRNVQIGQVLNLDLIDLGNGKSISGWYYDATYINRVTNTSYVVVTEAIIQGGLYPKFVTDYVTPDTGNPWPDYDNNYQPNFSGNPTTSIGTIRQLF